MTDQPVVRNADSSDLSYIESLRRKESESLGFIPAARYEAAVTGLGPSARPGDRLWVVEASGDRVGYLFLTGGLPGGAVKVIQVTVQPDARRLEYATALVREAEDFALWSGRVGVSLAVASDIEAAQFWEALGYSLRYRYTGGARRGRILERRVKLLQTGLWVPQGIAA